MNSEQGDYRVIKGTGRRACVSKSFALPNIIFCSCNVEEARRCKENYEHYKKANYNNQKGQESFTDATRE